MKQFPQTPWYSGLVTLGLCLALLSSAEVSAAVVPDQQGWIEIDYGPLLDRRQLTHSGDSVGVLLDRLASKPANLADGGRSERLFLSLLDPLLEPYAFVLPDAVDSYKQTEGAPYVEIGHLWHPGAAQPGWVELLRARHFLVESDGTGRMRFF